MEAQTIEKTVYFVRHGQSKANIAPEFQGLDSPLSEEGEVQAKSIAARVAKLSFDALIASPLQRAKQTAEAIGDAAEKEPEFSELFVESAKPASIHGKLYEDPSANTVWREWYKSLYTPGMQVEDGESYDSLLARVDAALAFLQSRPEESIVVVTHGHFLRTLVARVLLGKSFTPETLRSIHHTTSVENTAISAICYKEVFEQEVAWRLWIFNDHAHLG